MTVLCSHTFVLPARAAEIRSWLQAPGHLPTHLGHVQAAGPLAPGDSSWGTGPALAVLYEPLSVQERDVTVRVTVAPSAAQDGGFAAAAVVANALYTYEETWTLEPLGRSTRITRMWSKLEQFRHGWLPMRLWMRLHARRDCARIVNEWGSPLVSTQPVAAA